MRLFLSVVNSAQFIFNQFRAKVVIFRQFNEGFFRLRDFLAAFECTMPVLQVEKENRC
ncbi:MAG: hypothetical protein ANABAC_1583 [Anaerolineae bacterium]|nr:MAG: hypothetical protein ANABAC_1583 [Anaerolineae bacterium]